MHNEHTMTMNIFLLTESRRDLSETEFVVNRIQDNVVNANQDLITFQQHQDDNRGKYTQGV